MIINFSVENFGPIKEKQTLSFEAEASKHLEEYYVVEIIGIRLLKIALIYGANAAGKTTILKALDFLRDLVVEPEDKKTNVFDFQPFLFDANTPKQNSIMSIEFIQNEVKYFYEIEFFKQAIVREALFFYQPNKANVFKRTTNLSNQFTEITFGRKVNTDSIAKRTLEANTLWNNSVLGGFLKTNIELHELKEVTDWFTHFLSPIIYTKTELNPFITSKINQAETSKSHIIGILKKADFNISDILISSEEEDLPDGLVDFLEKQLDENSDVVKELKSKGKITSVSIEFEHSIEENSYVLPFELESEGTKRYYGFAGLLSLLINNSVAFSIDELESSLHPDLYIHFILSFINNAERSQIIATTHHREILNNKDIFRDDVIWIADKSEESATKLYALSDFDTSVIRDTTNRLNAYKSGKLGGVPNLGDIYITTD